MRGLGLLGKPHGARPRNKNDAISAYLLGGVGKAEYDYAARKRKFVVVGGVS